IPESGWSFPSGHATFFFALAAAVYLYNKKWGRGLFLAALIITLSRIIVGVHYPSDILGGMVIGMIVAYLTVSCFRKCGG
ncbi:MAG: phosphatase PAP2 family protein, partial [Minisyncoccia bacterium]